MAEPIMATTGSTTSSMTSTSHTMTAFPQSSTASHFPLAIPVKSSSMADLLAALAPSKRHTFITPSPSLPTASLEFAKATLDAFAGRLGDEQTARLKELRKKRKRGAPLRPEDGEILKIRKVHTEGFEVDQVWEQARRVIDALRGDAERGLGEIGDIGVGGDIQENGAVNGHGDVELLEFGEDGFEIGSEDESLDEEEDEDEDEEPAEPDDEYESEENDIAREPGFNLEDGDDYEEEEDVDDDDGDGADAGLFQEDPNGLNDGFFSIDEFNKQTQFLEQQDAAADPYTGEGSDEEDIDWDADPMSMTAKPLSSSRRAAAMDIDEDGGDDIDDEEEEVDEDGPTFGDMDLNAPEGDSEDEAAGSIIDGDREEAGNNTNDILYKDFFEPPPRKAGRGERQEKYTERQLRKTKRALPEDEEAGIAHAIADVRRDLFDDLSDRAGSEDESDIDPADPKSRRSAHERRQAKLGEEIRRLEAASVAKREWTLSGEARAADRPLNSLLEEDLDFERTGKPVPVITAEVSESIEELIKRRILAQEFDEVIRRRPDASSTPANTRRGVFEVDDSKPQQSLAELYEEEHIKANNPDTYVSKADEKVRKEEKEIEQLWKEVSAKLDALSSWHYKPKPAAPSLTVVADVATISMEDAQPTTASGVGGSESMLAPQEIYKAGKAKETIEKGEVVPKSGVPVARQEMTREEKLRRRRREKERIRKRGGEEINKKPEGKRAQQKRETIGELKRAGVKVIGRRGDIRDVEGNKIQAAAASQGAGGFKL